MTPFELIWQILWQGVLIGCVALVALNYAISRLGAERASALVALVPVLAAVLGFVFLGEVPSAAEVAAFVAISAGVSIGAAPGRSRLSRQAGRFQRRRKARELRAIPSGITRPECSHGQPGLELAHPAHCFSRLVDASRKHLRHRERAQSRCMQAVLAQRRLGELDRPLVALADQVGGARRAN